MAEQTADEDLASLRTQMQGKDAELAASRSAEASANAELAKARETATQAINDRVAADEIALRSAIAAADASTGALQKEYAEALEKGDFAAAATVNTKMVDARQNLSGFQRQLGQIDTWKKTQLAEIERLSREPPVQTDPLAQYKGKTREWLTQHMDVVSDPKKMARATAAHWDAVAEGLAFESPEYFKFVEGRVSPKATSTAAEMVEPGPSTMEEVVVEPKPAQQERRAPTDSAAAPSRQTPEPGRKERPGTVRLSAAEQEAARFSFPHLKPDEAAIEYAKNKAALQQEGRL